MSDLYDSLEEDESIERKSFSNDLDLSEATGMESVGRACESKSTDNFSFYLNGNVTQEKINLLPNFKSTNSQKKLFLPKIESDPRDKGLEPFGNIIVDNQILSKQGLQMNDDGSFTKSPRSEAEELPFITREYRNLQFQKKKIYRLKKRTSAEKIQSNITSVKKPVGIISGNEIIKTRIKKNNNEEISNSSGSLSPEPGRGKKKISEKKNPIIGCVKEVNSLEGNPSSKSIKPIGNLKKTKRELNLTEIQEMLEINKALHLKKKEVNNGCRRERSNCSDKDKNVKGTERQVSKHTSDILLSAPKRRLNYLEQHRLKNGFNPFHLRQWSKKVLSDTNRSNFGDSVVEELPEIPNLNFSTESGADEDEEMFYKKLIERDKYLKEKNHLSFRSDGPVERKKFTSMTNCQTEVLDRRNGGRYLGEKQIVKSLSIDLRPEAKPSIGFSKKSSHYCMTHSSPTVSKAELVLKGKTYGYMVNARNVFNLKAQAKRKLDAAGKIEKAKIKDNSFFSEKKASDLSPNQKKITKNKSSPVNGLSNVMEGLPKTIEKSFNVKKSLDKAGIPEVSEASQKRLILPRVNNSEARGGKRQERKFAFKSPKNMPS